MNLLNRHQHFAASARRDVPLQLIDLGALATDDDARPRGVDDDLQTIGGTLDVDMRDARAREALLQFALQLQILDQEIAVLLFRKPMRMPVLVIAEAKTVGMNFLAHSNLHFQIFKSQISNLRSSPQNPNSISQA